MDIFFRGRERGKLCILLLIPFRQGEATSTRTTRTSGQVSLRLPISRVVMVAQLVKRSLTAPGVHSSKAVNDIIEQFFTHCNLEKTKKEIRPGMVHLKNVLLPLHRINLLRIHWTFATVDVWKKLFVFMYLVKA